jgi:hypothetical protein
MWHSSASARNSGYFPGRELLEPLPLLGLGLILFNDYYLKGAWHNWLTGKLSDLGVMFLLPFLITATGSIVSAGLNRIPIISRWIGHVAVVRLTLPKVIIANVCAGLVLASIKLSPSLRDYYVVVLQYIDLFHWFRRFRCVSDPSDCVALLLLPLNIWYGMRLIRTYSRAEETGTR